jgi:hypothetical protein
MTSITFPSGESIDFGELSPEEIEPIISQLENEKPEIFQEVEEVKQNLSVAEIYDQAGVGPAKEVPEYKPSNEGEVDDAGFQFFYGRADSIGDKAKRLEATFGPGTFKQVEGTDKFTLLLDNISPEIKKEYGLPDTGDMYVNEPGMSWYDVAGFAGGEIVPLTAALGAGLVFSGVGIIPGMVIMSAAGGLGKAFDEIVIEDRLEKMNTQSDNEVLGDIAILAATYGIGEGVGRALWAGGRRLIKGPGARPDPARIAELVGTKMAGGMGRAEATTLAREEAKTELRRAVKEGARPTVTEVGQKAIMGRMQSIYEGIFPNAKAAAQNLEFVQATLGRLGAGEIDDVTAKSLLKDQLDAISSQVSNQMKNANVDETVRIANRHLEEVIENEFKVLLDMYNPNVGLKTGWQDMANMAARLFEQDSSILYKKSEDFLSKVMAADGTSAATFSGDQLRVIVKGFESNKALKAVTGDGFEKGLFKYIKDTTPDRKRIEKLVAGGMGKQAATKIAREEAGSFTMTELTALRSALRSAGKDPALMPGMNDSLIGTMIKGIDDTIENRLQGLAYLRVRSGPTAIPNRWDPETAKLFENGVMAWKKAQNFHAKGIQRFRSFSEEMLERNIRNGTTLGDKQVLNQVVQQGQPDMLLRYLKSVTPSGRAAEGIQKVPQSVFDDAAKAANEGQFKLANQILDNAEVSPEIVKRLPVFAEKLGVDDAYGRMIASEFSDTIRSLGRMAQARANPLQFRNRMRDSLAREWLTQNQTSSLVRGQFSPTVFASNFESLGVPLQNALFGKINGGAMRQLMRDYHKVGLGNKEFANASAEALGATASAIRARTMGLTGGRDVGEEIANIQSVMAEAKKQSEDALFQAIAKGTIDTPDALVLNILDNPKNYDRLVSSMSKSVGDDAAKAALDAPANVKDMVMGRIMEKAFPEGISPDRVSSGAWGAPMRRQLLELNRNGALAKVLGDGDQVAGQLVVNDLFKASKIGERISDQTLKGKQGLASAAFAAGAGMRLITNPLAFIGEAVGIFAMGRVMRQKWFLNSLLQPRYSAGLIRLKGGRRLLQQGQRAGVDLEGVSPLGLELRERVAQEARAVAASLQAQQVDSDTREDINAFIERNIAQPTRQTGQSVGPVVQDIRQQIPNAAAAAQAAVSPIRQAYLESIDPRKQALRSVVGQ